MALYREDTTYAVLENGKIRRLCPDTFQIIPCAMNGLPQDHQNKMSVLAIAPDNVRIPGVGIRSDMGLYSRYIITN